MTIDRSHGGTAGGGTAGRDTGDDYTDDEDDRTLLLRLGSGDDVLNLMAEATAGVCLDETRVSPVFFDLRSGVAGDVLQKCANYGYRLAVVVPDPARHGARFVELVREHQKHPLVRFPRIRAHAEAWLAVAARG